MKKEKRRSQKKSKEENVVCVGMYYQSRPMLQGNGKQRVILADVSNVQ